MAALSSVERRSSSSPQPHEEMVKLLHSLGDAQIQGMARLVAIVVAEKGVLQFKKGVTVQHQDDDADIIQLDVLTKLTLVATGFLQRGLTETIRNGAFSVFAKGNALVYTFQDILDDSGYLKDQVIPTLYFSFLITINIQIIKGTPTLIFFVADTEKQYVIDF